MYEKNGDLTKLKVEYSGKKDELMDRKDESMVPQFGFPQFHYLHLLVTDLHLAAGS